MPIRASARPDAGRLVRSAVLLASLLVLAAVVRDRLGGSPGAAETPSSAPATTCEADDVECPDPRPEPTVIPASDVCLRAGYLCAGLEDGDELRVVRWNDDTERLSVRIPSPPGVEPGRARTLQEAVARGIRSWHGRPFDLRVELSDRPGEHDIVVGWAPSLGDRELGRTRTRWVRREGRADLSVEELTLVHRNPWDPARGLAPRQLRLTAAHEMGHALGLPHSDEPRDVMYPENTATRLTARDFTTMTALYELENGAVVRVVR